MQTDLAESVREIVLATQRAVTSSEIAARLRRPRPEIEGALETMQQAADLVVRDWSMDDPHFAVERIVVAARIDPAGGDAAVGAAEARCQQVYDDLVRDLLASHRCV